MRSFFVFFYNLRKNFVWAQETGDFAYVFGKQLLIPTSTQESTQVANRNVVNNPKVFSAGSINRTQPVQRQKTGSAKKD